MGSVCVDDERAEALVALQSLPEEHDHLGRPGQRLVAAREIGSICLELASISDRDVACFDIAYRLVEYPSHTID